MNIVDAACSKCGAPTKYNGTLPILCRMCRTLDELVNKRNDNPSNMKILRRWEWSKLTLQNK